IGRTTRRPDRDRPRSVLPLGFLAVPATRAGEAPVFPARANAGDPGHHGAVPTAEEHPVNGPLERLIDNWCERRDLRPLALLLPAYTSNAGLTDDWAGVMDALHDLQSRGRLPAAERDEVERLLSIVERMV